MVVESQLTYSLIESNSFKIPEFFKKLSLPCIYVSESFLFALLLIDGKFLLFFYERLFRKIPERLEIGILFCPAETQT